MRTANLKLKGDKRMRIVMSAAKRFSEQGLSNTSLSDICQESGLTTGNLYYYFKTKDAIIEEVIKALTEEICDHAEQVFEEYGLIDALLNIAEVAARDRAARSISPSLHLEFIAEGTRNPVVAGLIEARATRLTAALSRAVDHAVATGQISSSVDKAALIECIAILWSGLATIGVSYGVSKYAGSVRTLLSALTNPTGTAL